MTERLAAIDLLWEQVPVFDYSHQEEFRRAQRHPPQRKGLWKSLCMSSPEPLTAPSA